MNHVKTTVMVKGSLVSDRNHTVVNIYQSDRYRKVKFHFTSKVSYN